MEKTFTFEVVAHLQGEDEAEIMRKRSALFMLFTRETRPFAVGIQVSELSIMKEDNGSN